MRKKRNLILTTLLLVISMLLSTATAFGVATDNLKPIKEGGSGVGVYKGNVNGKHAPWNKDTNAIELHKDYTNRLIRTGDNKSRIEEASGLKSNRDIVFSNAGGTYTMSSDLQFVFDVSDFNGTKNGAVKLRYTGYKIYNRDHAKADGEGFVWVDVVLTVTNWTKEASGIYNNSANAFSISKTLTGGYPAIRMCNIGELVIKYDYFLKGTDTQYKLKTNVTYRDIDAQQGIAFRSDTFEIVAVTPGTNLLYGTYGEDNEWNVFTSSGEESTSDNSRNAIGLAYDSDGSRVAYISNQHDLGKNPTYGEPGGYWAYFAPDTYSWFKPELSGPTKNVNDADEKNVTKNVIGKGQKKKWWYKVIQHIPGGMQSAFYFESFVITDEVDTCLDVTADDIKITSGGSDVTDQFTIKVSDANVVTATAKKAILNDADFYGGVHGNNITMRVNVKLNEEKFEANKDDHNHVIDDTQDEIINGADNTTYTTIDGKKYAANQVKTILTDEENPVITPPANPPKETGKTVSDSDQMEVKENMLYAPDEQYTYDVTANLPSLPEPEEEEGADGEDGEEEEPPYYTAFSFTDTLEAILQPISARVLSDGEDVTGSFSIRISGQNVTASMSSGALQSEDSYGRSYTLVIEAKIRTDEYYTPEHLDPWLSDDGITLTIPNDATVDMTDAEGSSDSTTTNQVITTVKMPTTEIGDPGIEVHKSVEPYEFQIGDEIPYKIEFKQNNPEATAMDVVIRDDTMPRGLNVLPESIKVTGLKGDYTARVIEGGLELKTWYLEYGEEVTIDFIAVAEKNLNGQVVPNTVTASAWGVPDKSDSTTIYLNSPKIDVNKSISKQSQGSVNNTINYEVRIKQINPGCFMRDIWFEDEILTPGAELEKGSFSVSDVDGNVLSLNTDYTLNIVDNKFKMVFTKGNMGYNDLTAAEGAENPYIPAWDDPRGQNATYYFKREAGSTAKDYENLELQKEYIVTYSAAIDASALAGETVENDAIVPTTENTNGDLIKNDPDIPSGGGEDEVIVQVEGPNLIPDKESDKREYNLGDIAEYKIQVGMIGDDMKAENVVIKDSFAQTGIAKIDAESIKVRFNNSDITWQCKIMVADDLQSFVIETERDMTQRDRITVEYLAEILGDGVLENTVIADADNAPEVDWTNDIIANPKPELNIVKTSDQQIYTIGDTATYEITVTQPVKGATARGVMVRDAFLDEGMVINGESFKVMLNEDNITEDCIINLQEDNKWRLETRRNMTDMDTLVITYDVTFTDQTPLENVNNIAIAVAENVPEVETEHEVELQEVEPDLEIIKSSDKDEYVIGDTANYSVKVRQTKEGAIARNVVVKDEFVQLGMKILPESIKVMMGEEDITDECKISATTKNWIVETGMNLRLDETITVTYDVTFHALSVEAEQTYYESEEGTETIVEDLKKSERLVRNIAATEADNVPKRDTEHVVKLRKPVLKVVKSSDDDVYTVGDKGKYTLIVTQEVEGGVAEQVVIEDKFDTKGVKIDRTSFVVKYGKRDITSNCKIMMESDNHFIIETKEDLKFGETIKVTYKAEFADEKLLKKKIRNDVIAEADNADPDEDKNIVKIKTPFGDKISEIIPGGGGNDGSPKTGDDRKMWPFIGAAMAALIIAAIAIISSRYEFVYEDDDDE